MVKTQRKALVEPNEKQSKDNMSYACQYEIMHRIV